MEDLSPQTPPSLSAQNTGYGQYGAAYAHTHTYQAGYGTVIPLRPLGIGDTLDATFRLLKFNPVAYFLFPLVVFLIAGIIDAVLTLTLGEVAIDTENFDAFAASMGTVSIQSSVSFLAMLFAGFLVSLIGTRITLASVQGVKLTFKQTWAMLKPKLGITLLRLIGFEAIVLAALIVIGLLLAAIIGVVVFLVFGSSLSAGFDTSSTITASVLAVIFILVLVMAIFFAVATFYLRFALAPCAIVAEEIGPLRAIARSWVLTKKSFGYLLGTVIVVSLIVGAMAFVLGAVFGVFTILLGSTSSLAMALSSIGTSIIASVAATPIQCALMNLIYVNMRFKRENFHLSLISQTQNLSSEYTPSPEYTSIAASQLSGQTIPEHPSQAR